MAIQAVKSPAGPESRSWTVSPVALGLLFIFAIGAYHGANIIAFERFRDRLSLGATESSTDAADTKRSALASLSAWKNTATVAMRARSVTLDFVLAEMAENSMAIENALTDLAAASPTSVASWQALAAYRKAINAPMEDVLAAFRMSALTGSHEAFFMVQRAVFGLENWTELPDHDRKIVLRDVQGTVLVPDLGRGERYRAIVKKKSEAERDSIRESLATSGLASRDVLGAMGL